MFDFLRRLFKPKLKLKTGSGVCIVPDGVDYTKFTAIGGGGGGGATGGIFAKGGKGGVGPNRAGGKGGIAISSGNDNNVTIEHLSLEEAAAAQGLSVAEFIKRNS